MRKEKYILCSTNESFSSLATGYLQMTAIHNEMTVNKHMTALYFTHPASLLPPTGNWLHKRYNLQNLCAFEADQSRKLLKGTKRAGGKKERNRKLQRERKVKGGGPRLPVQERAMIRDTSSQRGLAPFRAVLERWLHGITVCLFTGRLTPHFICTDSRSFINLTTDETSFFE